MVWILSILNLALVVQSNSPNPKGVLGGGDNKESYSITPHKNPSDEKLHIQIPYLHTGGMFSIQKY